MAFPIYDQIEFNKNNLNKNQVPFLLRMFSFVIDYFVFTPVVSFLVLILFTDGLQLYRSYPKSAEAQALFGFAAVGFVFVLTALQAAFIQYWNATPGQYFLKIRIEFENQDRPVFFMAWMRQLGFLFSFVMLGLPFLGLLSDKKNRAFYEKMTESFLYRLEPVGSFQPFQKQLATERKFWAAAFTTLTVFITALVVTVFWSNYKLLLSSPVAFEKMKNKNYFCSDFQDLKPLERLRYAIAMNIVGTYSDECLDKDADFVLWRQFDENRELAYFAKFIATDDEQLENDYLKEACRANVNNEGCFWAQVFSDNDFNRILTESKYRDTLLGQVLVYEMNPYHEDNENQKYLAAIKKFQNYKSVKKYVLLQTIDRIERQDLQNAGPAMNATKLRLPASLSSGRDEKSNYDELRKSVLDL